jgi:hypothetical protein
MALLVDVSQSTLDRYQLEKLPAYSRGGFPTYWIVNLFDGQVEVDTGPTPAGFAASQDYRSGQSVPVVIDGTEIGRIAVADILP